MPSRPQVDGASGLQLFPGSSPAGTAEQVPSLPLRVQEKQETVQARSQQTPLLQTPEAHWMP